MTLPLHALKAFLSATDYGDSGFCEQCDKYSTYDECMNDGLPDAGANDCMKECFGTSIWGEVTHLVF